MSTLQAYSLYIPPFRFQKGNRTISTLFHTDYGYYSIICRIMLLYIFTYIYNKIIKNSIYKILNMSIISVEIIKLLETGESPETQFVEFTGFMDFTGNTPLDHTVMW